MRTLGAALLAAVLTPAALSAAEPKDFDLQAWRENPARAAARHVKAEAPRGFKGTRRVFVSAFRLEFVVERDAWVDLPDAASKNMRVRLEGLDDAARQALADQAGQIFLGHLVKHGFELVMPTALSGQPAYQEIAAWASTTPVRRGFQDPEDGTGGEVAVYSPAGMPLYYHSSEPGGSALGAAVKGSPDDLEPLLVHRFDAALLRVTLRADFLKFAPVRKIFKDKANVLPYEPMLRVTGRVDAVAPASISVEERPFNRGTKVSAAAVQPAFRLEAPVASADYFVLKSDVRDVSSKDGGVKEVDMRINPAVYGEALLRNLRAASDVLVQRMMESR